MTGDELPRLVVTFEQDLTDDQCDRIAAMLREPDDAMLAVLRARVVAHRDDPAKPDGTEWGRAVAAPVADGQAQIPADDDWPDDDGPGIDLPARRVVTVDTRDRT
jgi:hypothetical protein